MKGTEITVAAARRIASTVPVLTSAIAPSLLRADELSELVTVLRRGERSWTSASGLRLERTAANELLLREREGQIIARLDDRAVEEAGEAVDRIANWPGPIGPLAKQATLNLPALARHVAAEIPQDRSGRPIGADSCMLVRPRSCAPIQLWPAGLSQPIPSSHRYSRSAIWPI